MQMRLFDGQIMDAEAVRVAGTIDIEEEDVSQFTYGNTVVLAFVATVDGATVKRKPNGDSRRVNALVPVAMRAVGGDLRNQLLSVLGLDIQDQLPLSEVNPPSPVAEQIDEEEEVDEGWVLGRDFQDFDDTDMTSDEFDRAFADSTPATVVTSTPVVKRVDSALQDFLSEAVSP